MVKYDIISIMKYLFPILLISSLIAQNTSNQNSYSIYTNTGFYHNVVLHQVNSYDLIATNKSRTKKYAIPISSVERIRIRETGSSYLGKVFCTGFGALGGTMIALFSNGGVSMGSPDATTSDSDTAVVLSGLTIGLLIGNSVGGSLFGSQTEFVSLKDKTLGEKRNYFKSMIGDQK